MLRTARLALALLLSAPPLAADHLLRNLSSGYRPDGEVRLSSWSADGERVLFGVCAETPGAPCYIATAGRNPGPALELAGPFHTGPTENLLFAISHDGRHAVYRSVPEDDTFPRELWSVPVDASAPPIRLHPFLIQNERVRFFLLSPDGERLAFVVRYANGVEELLLGSVDGSPGATVVDSGVEFDADEIAFSPSGAELVYWLDTDDDGDLELRAVATASGVSRPVAGVTQPSASSRGELLVTEDDAHVVFALEAADSGRMFLKSADLAPGGDDRDLTGGVAPDSSVGPYALASGGRAVFLGDLAVAGQVELWSVPVDGSSERSRLNGDLPASGDVDSFRIAGAWVAYLADEAVNERRELWSAPVHGLFEPTRRSDVLAAGRDVGDFRVTADGLRLVYEADGEADDRLDLYVATTSGLNAVARLTNRNPFQSGFYSVAEFALAPDSRTVVWVNSTEEALPGAILEQDLSSPNDFAPVLAELAYAGAFSYLGDPWGIGFRGFETSVGRTDVFTLDRRIFADRFESGGTSAWNP
jgi:Tol biopolymer transport system component